MQWTFNDLLRKAGINLADVRLVRHQERGPGGTTFQLSQENRVAWQQFEAVQGIIRRKEFSGKYWASFVVRPDGQTLFVRLSEATYLGLNKGVSFSPISHKSHEPGTVDTYLIKELIEWSGLSQRLIIDWGKGTRSWVQRADRQDKPIIELMQDISEPIFPGFEKFMCRLSDLDALPSSWITALKAVSGIYLLTCPKTREQYVGSASGEHGLWGRWIQYAANNHGGNIKLKNRDNSDFQLSILEITSFTSTLDEIIDKENIWKQKLQSRDMGLNSN